MWSWLTGRFAGASSPPPAPGGLEQASVVIVNSSRYFVSVEYRGPERRSLQLQPDSTSRIDLAPGRYRESAQVPNSTIPPLATDYEFAARKRYRLEFRFVED